MAVSHFTNALNSALVPSFYTVTWRAETGQ